MWQHDELGGRGADDRKRETEAGTIEWRQGRTNTNKEEKAIYYKDEEGKVQGKGKLKWGIGKMIAHAPRPPGKLQNLCKKAHIKLLTKASISSLLVVIPFCHTGMESIMPQDPATRRTLSPVPVPLHDVRVQFGEEIDFADLIEEHEQQVSDSEQTSSCPVHLICCPHSVFNI